MYAWDPSTRETETGGPGFHSHPQLYSKLETNWHYVRTLSQEQNKIITSSYSKATALWEGVNFATVQTTGAEGW